MKSVSLTIALLLGALTCLTRSSPTSYNENRTTDALIPCDGAWTTKNTTTNFVAKFTWIFNGKPISEMSDKYRTTGFGDLLINDFTYRDYGVYVCQVDDEAAEIQSTDSVIKYVDHTYAISDAQCALRSCVAAEKCRHAGLPTSCPDRGEVCCSVVLEKDKHLCRHFLGECMEYCNRQIQITRAEDCKGDERCCPLLVA
ncbi:uncharacterized protein LOC106651709 [Trichogramma pretiosum]|uniref:uncharacterized protein LOC106651709 n=1 Tax=Trichogramma pretiosum TaxID=7493 RepID=UPI000C719F01|nr:uncharacterized protein LOC106651709 [Trichogramma pretiosum]